MNSGCQTSVWTPFVRRKRFYGVLAHGVPALTTYCWQACPLDVSFSSWARVSAFNMPNIIRAIPVMNINGSNNGCLCQIRFAFGEAFVDDDGFDIFSFSFDLLLSTRLYQMTIPPPSPIFRGFSIFSMTISFMPNVDF